MAKVKSFALVCTLPGVATSHPSASAPFLHLSLRRRRRVDPHLRLGRQHCSSSPRSLHRDEPGRIEHYVQEGSPSRFFWHLRPSDAFSHRKSWRRCSQRAGLSHSILSGLAGNAEAQRGTCTIPGRCRFASVWDRSPGLILHRPSRLEPHAAPSSIAFLVSHIVA